MKPLGIPKNLSFNITRSVKKQPSILERRRLNSNTGSFISLSVSAKSTISDPKEELRAGLFDLDRSHLKHMKSPEDKTSPHQEINEDAIDAFLETEDVFPVDI